MCCKSNCETHFSHKTLLDTVATEWQPGSLVTISSSAPGSLRWCLSYVWVLEKTDSSFISQKTQLHLGVCLTTGYWPLTLQATSSTPGGRFNHPATGELNFPRARRQGKYRNRNRATKEPHSQTVSQYLSLQNTVHSARRLWMYGNRETDRGLAGVMGKPGQTG